MARDAQLYAVGLVEHLMGSAEHETRFDWARGDPGMRAMGVPLPFDAVWEVHRRIVEVDERQHSEPVPFFDMLGRMTCRAFIVASPSLRTTRPSCRAWLAPKRPVR